MSRIQLIYTKRYIKSNREKQSRRTPEPGRNDQNPHYGHKKHTDEQFLSVNDEREPRSVRSPDGDVSECGWEENGRCTVIRFEREDNG